MSVPNHVYDATAKEALAWGDRLVAGVFEPRIRLITLEAWARAQGRSLNISDMVEAMRDIGTMLERQYGRYGMQFWTFTSSSPEVQAIEFPARIRKGAWWTYRADARLRRILQPVIYMMEGLLMMSHDIAHFKNGSARNLNAYEPTTLKQAYQRARDWEP